MTEEERKAKKTAYMKAYYEANKEKIATQQKAYYEDNRGEKVAKQKAYYEANKEKIADKAKAYRGSNKDKVASENKAYREANKGKVATQKKAYYEANKEKIATQQKAYCEANPEVFAAASRKRRAIKKGAYVPRCSHWEDVEKQLVGRREELRATTGITYHIDHIYPLSKGGIDHPSNYQLLLPEENISKGDRVDSSCPNQMRMKEVSELVLNLGMDIDSALQLTERENI